MIVISGVYKKVKTGRDGDRVYLFQIDNLRFFFWMQDKDAVADEDNCKKLNEYMNNPNAIPAPASANASQNEALMRLLG